MNSVFDLQRLYYQDLNIEFAKAKLEAAFYLVFNGKGQVCPGLGWNHDAADLKVEMTSHFDQCSKILIDNIGPGAFNGIWRGDEAQWFQECEDSSDVTMTFNTWNFKTSV